MTYRAKSGKWMTRGGNLDKQSSQKWKHFANIASDKSKGKGKKGKGGRNK
jgi:hypothetical protein